MRTTGKITALALALIMLCSTGFAFAQDTPEKPVRVALLNSYENDFTVVPDALKNVLEYKVYERMIDIVQALVSSAVDYGRTATMNADYIIANNDLLAGADTDGEITFFMGTMPGNTQLQALLNDGIQALKDSGKLDELIKTWLTDIDDAQPAVEPLPEIEGAQTIRIAVTGDMPPLDYTDTLGNPAGFNIAMLSALSEVMHVNFETVTVDSPARLVALATGKADALFYALGVTPQPVELDERVLLTDRYYACGVKRIFLKENEDMVNAGIARVAQAAAALAESAQ